MKNTNLLDSENIIDTLASVKEFHQRENLIHGDSVLSVNTVQVSVRFQILGYEV